MTQFNLADELNRLHALTGSWREVGWALGRSGTYALRVARGDLQPSRAALDAWREWQTGQRQRYSPAPVCPDCGNVHAGRCHGKPVAQVVCLAPDETVRPVARQRRGEPRVSIGGLQPATRSAAQAARQPGETWNTFIQRAIAALAEQEPQA